MTPRRRNDRKARLRSAPWAPRHRPPAGDWLWGWHAVLAALGNPAREPARRILATPARAEALEKAFDTAPWPAAALETMDAAEIAALLPSGAVHQGLAADLPALETSPLAALALPPAGLLVMLDQVTDPQNVGAVFRSAAAFSARGVILQDRHAPPLAGALAKAAAGAVDRIAHAREINLARALERLADYGWRSVGLAGDAETDLADALDGGPTVLVLGSEGEGLRRLVRERCDALARIPIAAGVESLNVSAAAAVALHEAQRAAGARRP